MVGAAGGRFGHRDVLISDENLHPLAGGGVEGSRHLVGHPAGADEKELKFRIGLAGSQSAVNHDGGGIVPAEEVDGDPRPGSPPGRRSRHPCPGLRPR
ncbi:hypothetical protein GCM10009681_31610 [Luedemannella helvata]|uniref:Uncharacterized protein n=1 Tax=Luedemannella helvata TaxID=349315 RepID=A0ABN2KJR2_9ACTN